MSAALLVLFIVTGSLDAVLVARADLGRESSPIQGEASELPEIRNRQSESLEFSRSTGFWRHLRTFVKGIQLLIQRLNHGWYALMTWITNWLEVWTAPQEDQQIAWTLGIGWACSGGGLAGGCLVFAKAIVKLLSGSLSKQNPGNQFGHAAPIFTIILLSTTAVMQIICLNRGLRVYDSTLVVPVFYGVYTATGWLDSLIFNDEVDAYQSWTLFLIFVSILILISGVVLLTHKKPEMTGNTPLPSSKAVGGRRRRERRTVGNDGEENRLEEAGEQDALWTLGGGSDSEDLDEDADHHQHPIKVQHRPRGVANGGTLAGESVQYQERSGLMADDDDNDDDDDEISAEDNGEHRLPPL